MLRFTNRLLLKNKRNEHKMKSLYVVIFIYDTLTGINFQFLSGQIDHIYDNFTSIQ